MPLTRPAEISNGVSLSNKVTREIGSRIIVSEDGTIDACLALSGSFVNAIVDELSPNKERVSIEGSESVNFAGTDELSPLSTVSVDS